MELVISIVALLTAVYALIVARGLRQRVSKLDGESLYRSGQIRESAEQLEQRIRLLGRFVSLVSQGRRFSEEQIQEDRLFENVDADRARDLIDRGEVVVVDVRESHEYAAGHLPSAILLPVSQLEERWREVPRGGPALVYCGSGSRSRSACRFLSQEKGYTELFNLEGGIACWEGQTETGMARSPKRSISTSPPTSDS